MKLFAFNLLLIWLCACSSAVAAQISVNFQASATVTDSRIVLADIAVIKPEGSKADAIGKLPVAAAPVPGATKELRTVSVITSLRNRAEVADVDWQGSETIVVQRKGTRVDKEQLQKIVEDYLKENEAKLPKAEIRLASFRAPEQIYLPSGTLSWKVTPSRPDIMSSASFSIQFSIDGAPAGNCVVQGRVEAYADVVIAKTTLHKDDLVTEDKIAVEKRRIDRMKNPVFSPDEILDMQVGRTINAGNPIEHEHINSPPVIKKDDLVKILARKGALNISASGIAREDGRQGETIQVKNVSSNKLIHCRVDGPGIVSVEF